MIAPQLVELPPRAFAGLLRESPQLQLKVLRTLAERVAQEQPV